MTSEVDQQDRDYEWFVQHHEELEEHYTGRVVAIYKEQILGDYASEGEAAEATIKTHALGTFIVQRVRPGNPPHHI